MNLVEEQVMAQRPVNNRNCKRMARGGRRCWGHNMADREGAESRWRVAAEATRCDVTRALSNSRLYKCGQKLVPGELYVNHATVVILACLDGVEKIFTVTNWSKHNASWLTCVAFVTCVTCSGRLQQMSVTER
jgi:hypothetical protein